MTELDHAAKSAESAFALYMSLYSTGLMRTKHAREAALVSAQALASAANAHLEHVKATIESEKEVPRLR